MSKTAIRYIAALVVAGASVLPAIASAQGGGSYTGGPSNTDMHYRMQWNGNQPYYYDQNHKRHNMTSQEVRAYARQQEPQWYSSHKNESSRSFMRDWKGEYSRHNAQLNQGGS